MQNTIRWRSHWLDGAVVSCCLETPGYLLFSSQIHFWYLKDFLNNSICLLTLMRLVEERMVQALKKVMKKMRQKLQRFCSHYE